jgi:hypothetical protein
MNMKIRTVIGLAALTELVTGCPHNDYTIELTPRGNVIERKLVFYRADGTESKGVPKYEGFPSNELAAISALYPHGALTPEGERHFARGEFSGATPGDVGGAGAYTNYSSSLGSAGFYIERFRGSDDLSAQQEKRLTAADQLADLVVGWSKAEFGLEPRYQDLRRFLDVDVRRDLKNAALYSWVGDIASSYQEHAQEEFIGRFGLYLVERGYLKLADAPLVAQLMVGSDTSVAATLAQRLVAEKLGMPPSGTTRDRLAFLVDPVALQKSWETFLSGTELYQSRMRKWHEEEQEGKHEADAKEPTPSEVANDLVAALITSGSSGEDDHLTVRLALPSVPDHTNGKWDEARRQVVWDSALEAKESAARLPVFCYAIWSQPENQFQQDHFGRVILKGDDLLKYNLWRAQLNEPQAGEWEKLLLSLWPDELTNKLAAFEFSAVGQVQAASASYAKELIKSALGQQR